MKATIKIIILSLVLNAGTWLTSQKTSAQVTVSFQLFYDDLSPHGYWVDNSDYGYVWVPNVSAGFIPYSTNGHWVFTNAGWTWFSDYPWGWAPFHYGRWYNDPYYGPMWVPGNEWGPGWVTWRSSAGYYGWAPIGPGISINFAYSSGYNLPYNQWTFVRDRDFGSTNISNYYVDRTNNTTIINNSTVINNIQADGSSSVRYNAGPERTEVQSRTGTQITQVALRESNKPGQNLSNGELQLYRPQIEKNNAIGQKPAPAKVTSLKDVKPAAERNTEIQPEKNNQPGKAQPAKREHSDQPAKQQPAQQQRGSQEIKEQPSQRQRSDQPAKQQPSKQLQRDNQPKKEQPSQRQRSDQPAKQQPSQQLQRDNQPKKEQPSQRQRSDQPAKQQPSQQIQRDNQPLKEKPTQRQRIVRPAKQQPSQQQRNGNGQNKDQQPVLPQNKEEDGKPH